MNELKSLVGKEVQIYPGDTHSKYGLVLEVSDVGVLFKITKAHPSSGYTVGKRHFIAYSSRLNFKEI